MKKQLWLSSAVLILFFVLIGDSICLAQNNQQDERGSNGLPARFTAERKEMGFFCGPFLPNQIPGITELMPLCGVRLGLKMNDNTWLEPAFLSGSGSTQQYRIGSLSFRTDVAYDDLVASLFAGGDVHAATSPVLDSNGNASSDSTSIYFGGHVGGAIWAKINDVFYLRTDMVFNLLPGTSLFIGFGLEFRFDPGSTDQGGGSQGPR